LNTKLLSKMNDHKIEDVKKSIVQFHAMKEQLQKNKLNSHPVKAITDKINT
jgi:hypothetical protein